MWFLSSLSLFGYTAVTTALESFWQPFSRSLLVNLHLSTMADRVADSGETGGNGMIGEHGRMAARAVIRTSRLEGKEEVH